MLNLHKKLQKTLDDNVAKYSDNRELAYTNAVKDAFELLLKASHTDLIKYFEDMIFSEYESIYLDKKDRNFKDEKDLVDFNSPYLESLGEESKNQILTNLNARLKKKKIIN